MKISALRCAGFALLFVFFAGIAAGADHVTREQDFVLSDLHGSKVALASFLDNKRPVLLFFWTTWCPYCLKDMKNIDRLAAEYKDAVTILAINAGEDKRDVERVVRNYGVKTIVLIDPAQTATEGFHVIGVPTFVLINGAGDIEVNDNYFPEKEIRALAGERKS